MLASLSFEPNSFKILEFITFCRNFSSSIKLDNCFIFTGISFKIIIELTKV